uniref:Clathrin binding protein n=1 Tax=Rhizophora mucronata TaxID=61149 RepID=A0A2P2L260_RHIMU
MVIYSLHMDLKLNHFQVDAERCYHQHVLTILDKLHAEIILEEQLNESSSQSVNIQRDVNAPLVKEESTSNGPDDQVHSDQKDALFMGKVVHPFDAQAEGELSLSVDDYVVVLLVDPTGWSKGECRGNIGWFPSAYIEKQEKAPVAS